jgi:hypothetical protein
VYGLTCDFAKIQPPPAQMLQLLGAVSTNPNMQGSSEPQAVTAATARASRASGGQRRVGSCACNAIREGARIFRSIDERRRTCSSGWCGSPM